MREYTAEQKKKAAEWFEKFCALLQTKGVELDNPYALGLVCISKKLPSSRIDRSTATPEEIGAEMERLDDAERYAFMKRNEDDSYVVPRPEEGRSDEWLVDNMRPAKDLTDEDKADLYDHYLRGELYLGEDRVVAEMKSDHLHIVENEQGELRFVEKLSQLQEDYTERNGEMRYLQDRIDALNIEIERARNGKKIVKKPITEQSMQEQFEADRDKASADYLAARDALDLGKYPDGTSIPDDKLAEQATHVKSLNREMNRLNEILKDRKYDVEVDMTTEERTEILSKYLPQRDELQQQMQQMKATPFQYEEAGLSKEQFDKISGVRSYSGIQGMTVFQIGDRLLERMSRYGKAIKKGNTELAETIRADYRAGFVGRQRKSVERNLCAIGKKHREWIELRGSREVYDALMAAGIDPRMRSEEEKQAATGKIYLNKDLGSTEKSLLKKTGESSVEELCRSGKVRHEDGTTYPTNSYDFLTELMQAQATEQCFILQYKDKKGETKEGLFKTQADMGVMPAKDVTQYRKCFDELAAELQATDHRFSRDSKEYKDLVKCVRAKQEELRKNNNRYDIGFGFGDVARSCEEYIKKHAEQKHLSDRQQRRLSVMRRLIDLSDLSSKDAVEPNNDRNKVALLANKIVCAQARTMQLDKSLEGEGKQLLLNKEAFRARQQAVMDNPVFRKMVLDAGPQGLDDLKAIPDMKLMKRMDDLAERMIAEGPTEEAGQYVDNTGPDEPGLKPEMFSLR